MQAIGTEVWVSGTHIDAGQVLWSTYNPSSWAAGTVALWSKLLARSEGWASSGFKQDILPQYIKWRVIDEDTWHQPLASI